MRAPVVLTVVLGLLAGCAARPIRNEALPSIEVRPGLEARLALMDRYRLHDEERRRFMDRPRVWVEEVAEGEEGGAGADAATEDERAPSDKIPVENAP